MYSRTSCESESLVRSMNINQTPPTGRLSRLAPGLAMLRAYQPGWLQYDLAAGLSVAAVALPTAIAYAQLAGFPPVVGLYASILPLVVYAILGTSRQLIVNPDAAVCAMVAAIVAPLAGQDAGLYTRWPCRWRPGRRGLHRGRVVPARFPR